MIRCQDPYKQATNLRACITLCEELAPAIHAVIDKWGEKRVTRRLVTAIEAVHPALICRYETGFSIDVQYSPTAWQAREADYPTLPTDRDHITIASLYIHDGVVDQVCMWTTGEGARKRAAAIDRYLADPESVKAEYNAALEHYRAALDAIGGDLISIYAINDGPRFARPM